MTLDAYLFNLFFIQNNGQSPVKPDVLFKQWSQQKENKEEKARMGYIPGDGLLAYMRTIVAQENNGNAEEQARKLFTLFGDSPEVLQYLADYTKQHQETKTPIHDACLFTLPNDLNNWSKLLLWQQLAKRFKYELWFMNLLPLARDIEKNKRFNERIDKKTLLEITTALTYNPRLVEQNPTAADLFREWKINEYVLKEYLQLKPIDDLKLVPKVDIEVFEDKESPLHFKQRNIISPKNLVLPDKSESKEKGKKTKPKFTIEKLPSNDPQAAILGYFVGDCQSLGKQGASCAIYGITHPNSGFYVVKKNGKIVAQTWAWRESDTLVFDSIERGRRIVSTKTAAAFAKKLEYSPIQFIRLAIQDDLNKNGLHFEVEIHTQKTAA